MTKRFSGEKHAVRSRKGERGATLILVTFVATFVLIPIIGLAIDGTLLYWMKARLSASVDAAALAAARSLNVGDDEAAQELSASTVGQQYFSANFPLGTGSRVITIAGGGPTISYVRGAYVRTVTINATAMVPLLFMPVLGVDLGTLAASGTASRRDANVILVLDRSGSMSTACSALVAAVQVNFIARFANGRDRLGLVTFSTTAHLDFAPSLTFKSDNPSLSSVLATLYCTGSTSTTEGLAMAYAQILAIKQPGAFNVILLFTDGSPSAIHAIFPIKRQPDTRYGVDTRTTSSSVPGPAPASTCTPASLATLDGILADTGSDNAATILLLDKTGPTVGLFSPTGVSLSSRASAPILAAPGCSFSTNQNAVRNDVAYIPASDFNNNATNGAVYPLQAPIDRFDSSNPVAAYRNQIRPDVPRTVRWVAFNAADAEAQRIRADTVYAPVIYTIGLAGNEQMAMDQNFMERLANDPRANNYDRIKPQGMFKLATDKGGVAQAFNDIASQVLHLSK